MKYKPISTSGVLNLGKQNTVCNFSPATCGKQNTVCNFSPATCGEQNTLCNFSPATCGKQNTLCNFSPATCGKKNTLCNFSPATCGKQNTCYFLTFACGFHLYYSFYADLQTRRFRKKIKVGCTIMRNQLLSFNFYLLFFFV
jgi:hypothetical protein